MEKRRKKRRKKRKKALDLRQKFGVIFAPI